MIKVIVLGRCGVGKSSLVNYLVGECVAETGISGSAITKETKEYPFKHFFTRFSVFDTAGIDEKDPQATIDLFVREELKPCAEKKDKGCFVYCISASGARIVTMDLKTISSILEKGYRPVVVFTKSDMASLEDSKILENTVAKEFPNVKIKFVDVASVEKSFGRSKLISNLKSQKN